LLFLFSSLISLCSLCTCLCDANADVDSNVLLWDGVGSKGGSGLRTEYACLVKDTEGTLAIRDGKGGFGSKIKVDVCLGCPVLGLKGSSLICLPLCSN